MNNTINRILVGLASSLTVIVIGTSAAAAPQPETGPSANFNITVADYSASVRDAWVADASGRKVLSCSKTVSKSDVVDERNKKVGQVDDVRFSCWGELGTVKERASYSLKVKTSKSTSSHSLSFMLTPKIPGMLGHYYGAYSVDGGTVEKLASKPRVL